MSEFRATTVIHEQTVHRFACPFMSHCVAEVSNFEQISSQLQVPVAVEANIDTS